MSLISGRVSFDAGGRSILADVDLEIGKAESVAIVGVNGAGKTTLLRLLANVLEPTRGSLALSGTSYAKHHARELAKLLAYVPQVRPARVPLPVRDVVLLGRYPHQPRWGFGYGDADFRAVTAALETTGLVELSDRPLAELSGGERQGVYIAAALAQEAECLLLDEPTTYLDPGHQRRIAHLLRRLTEREERTVVFASHDLNLAYALADRVIVLQEGRVEAEGPTSEVLESALLERVYEAPFHVHLPQSGASGVSVVAVDFGTPLEAGSSPANARE
ncbi:MAG: ABC transporter ATP-binding protein [Thermoanaerobaculia bacterium]